MPPDARFHYIIAVIDWFTRYAIVGALQSKEQPVIIRWLSDNFFTKFGCVETFVSDQGSEFTGTEFADLLRLLRIRHHLNTTAHPQANGLVERLNRTLLQKLAALNLQLSQVPNDQPLPYQMWTRLVQFVAFSYNISYNRTIGDTPFFMLHGFDPLLPYDTWIAKDQDPPLTPAAYKGALVQRLRQA